MCGIIGYFGGANFEKLRAGLFEIAHRGPDDEGLFEDSVFGVGLGHARLSILDTSQQGHQPMVSFNGVATIVFNGEIYNFRELRAELEMSGFVFRSNSDTEVILNLYLQDGEAMLSRLNGIFSLAIWDIRSKSLLVARDAFGVKPFYFSNIGGQFAFSSEIKGLIKIVPDARQINIQSVHRYLSFLWCPGDGTPLKDVYKLGPGEAMRIRNGAIEHRWRWYQLPLARGVSGDLKKNEAIIGVERHLRKAVHRQLVSDVPIGAFLSGGLDSSAIVAFAREERPNLQCFTINATGGDDDGGNYDLPYAIKAAKHLNVNLEVINVSANSMADNLIKMIERLDEPLADPAAFNVFYISQMARNHGIKVLLSGAGGDDIFSGYRRHQALRYEKCWAWLPQNIRKNIEKTTTHFDARVAFFRRLEKIFSGASLEGDERIANYFRWTKEEDVMRLYSPAIRNEVLGEMASDLIVDFLDSLPEAACPLDRMLAVEQRFFLTDHNLSYTDKMSMAAGVEVRVPFLDLELVEFAAHIPDLYKQHWSQGKWVLKKAMESYLPKEIIYRPKTGFGAPLRSWMRNDLRPLLSDVLSAKSLQKRGIFDSDAVQKLIFDNDAGRVDAGYTLLALIFLEIWFRKYVD